MALPKLKDRRRYLYGYDDPFSGKKTKGILQTRGQAHVKKMEATITALWNANNK
jgi:hypothetical protein